jgi:hypothetical protein
MSPPPDGLARTLILTNLLMAFALSPVWAQPLVGPELQVNTYCTADPEYPRGAIAPSGDFVVV